MRIPDLAALAAVLALGAACGKKTDAPKTEAAPTTPEAAHEHPPAPHGGEILELGEEDYHLEMIHDHDGGNVTVYVLGKDLKTPVAVEPPVINLQTKDGPVQVTLTAIQAGADGKADAWKGSHAGLKADPWDGRIRVKVGDKTYQSPLEGAAHSHD